MGLIPQGLAGVGVFFEMAEQWEQKKPMRPTKINMNIIGFNFFMRSYAFFDSSRFFRPFFLALTKIDMLPWGCLFSRIN